MKRFLNQLLTLVFGTVLAVNINAQCIETATFGSATVGPCSGAVSYTHLDVYKRQIGTL